MSITFKRPMFRMGGQARSEDTGITSGLRQPYQVGRLVTDESGSYENYPYGVSPSPDLMGIGAAANTLGLLNSFSKANPASSFFPKLDQEGEAEPVSIEDKINRIKKQYEVTPRDDFNALIEGVGQGFTGAYTLGEALNKSAQARRQIIDPRAQRAQDVAAKLDLLPLEQSYKERLQAMKNKEKTYALTDKINQLNKNMTRLYEIDDKLKDPNVSVVDRTKLQREKKILEGTIETILPKSDPFLDAFLKTREGQKMFEPIITEILKEKGVKPDKDGNLPPLPPNLYPEVVRRAKEYFRSRDQGMKKGGRVGMEEGGISSDYTETDTEVLSEENDRGMMDLVAQQTTQTTPAPVQQISQEQVKPLTYGELRSRLPREITNEVVNLLSKSQQALVDFANITTQKDVVEFNAKYGVNLVLPQV
jgi:hypothetical protein